jgi:hypothetical protein
MPEQKTYATFEEFFKSNFIAPSEYDRMVGKSSWKAGQQSRQPEIDKLKKEVEELIDQKQCGRKTC